MKKPILYFKTIVIGLLLCAGLIQTAGASSTRTLDADSIKSSDHTKTYTLPSSTSTLATTSLSEALTNKTMSGASNTFSNIPSSALKLGSTINAQSGTTYTFVLADGSDAGSNPVVTFSSASATTVTVPPNSSVAFPVGTIINCVQLGAGKVTFSPGSGVTINSQSSNLSIAAQYVGVTLLKTATDTWVLLGNLTT